MIGLTSVALSATIMWNILKTIYMKQKQKETILGWWLWKLCIQIIENSVLWYCAYDSFVKFGERIIVF